MPVTGRKPKPGAVHRPSANEPRHEWTDVLDVPFDGAPRLPRIRPGGKTWPRRTKDWWRAVSTMPHCVLWKDSDWSFAIDTAMLAAEFHDGDMPRATELRQREKILGTTADARRDLRLRYLRPTSIEPDQPDAVAPVAQLDAYREMFDQS